ncbi:TRAP transporter large permease [Pseudahrensia aquimaris]|uniref:TRAP transporter large permease protein n=1 Tax=Pseudahrensia aquimaris TaxID=744461 RepID=A0ABW3FBW8_9HYPH
MLELIAVLFGTFIILLLIGWPVFLAMGLAVAAYAWWFAPNLPDIVVVQSMMSGLDKTDFTAIPFFFLAGAIMNQGGMSARLLRLARSILAHFRGGLAHANIGASMVFAGVSGSAVADVAAVGSVMIPAMKKEGYSGAYAAAVTSSSATIGLVIPPSIPMVIFGLFTGAPIGDLFLAGLLPGLAMGGFLLVASALIARRRGYPASRWQGWREIWDAFKASFFALLMPVVVVSGLVMGFATTSEIGAVAAFYAAFVSLFIYRETTPLELARALGEAAVDSARVLIIIAVSGGFVWIIAYSGIARELVAAITETGLQGTMLLVLIAIVLLLAGTMLEPITLLVVVVPILVPVALAGGVDLVHLGVVAILASSIGLVTPPVGILLYITAAQAGSSAIDVIRESAPYLVALFALVIMVVLFPQLSLWLPSLSP